MCKKIWCKESIKLHRNRNLKKETQYWTCRSKHQLTHVFSHHTITCSFYSQQPLSAVTDATTLFSRQSTLEDLDGMPECIPKTSERARPKLHKMYSLDMSNSSVDSGSSVVSRFKSTLRHWWLSSHWSLHIFSWIVATKMYNPKCVFLTLKYNCIAGIRINNHIVTCNTDERSFLMV